ncbi:hypothetical protein J2Y40_001284 [Chryseobacterium sp. 2987]|nr:hypothetical protein [Chryseobacterium sp. 2987]
MISKVDTDILKSTLLLIFYGWGEENAVGINETETTILL